MNFISETKLEEIKNTVGERVEDGTVTVDKPLYEVLKEQKEKKEAEFKEKYKNLPPKGLDEEELEFLETLDKHRKEQEREKAQQDEEALTQFHTAILSRTVKVTEAREQHPGQASDSQTAGTKRKSEQQPRAKSMFAPKFKVGVMVQPKKAKGSGTASQVKASSSGAPKAEASVRGSGEGRAAEGGAREKEDGSREHTQTVGKQANGSKSQGSGGAGKAQNTGEKAQQQVGLGGLVAYGDDSDEDDDDVKD